MLCVTACENLLSANYRGIGELSECDSTCSAENVEVCQSQINPIWNGLFANLKRLGGGILPPPPPPNLTISSQKTMKLGKGILWVEIFTN